MYFFEKALELIFLPCCGVCGKLGEGYLCTKCGKELEKYVIEAKAETKEDGAIRLEKTKMLENVGVLENREVEGTKAGTSIPKQHLFKYKDLIRDLILDYKFNDKSYLYKTFCEFIVKNKKNLDFIKSYDIIIPVPIHSVRIRKRGYNQSTLIAKELARSFEMKVYTNVLLKIKNNKVQSTLNKKEREENTKNVYKLVKPEKIKNKKILLLDDIYTTGATANACTKELEKANVEKIGIFTIAKD